VTFYYTTFNSLPILVTPTRPRHILSAIPEPLQMSARSTIPTGGFHRPTCSQTSENKNLRQRIVFWLRQSPLRRQGVNENGMTKLAKKLKNTMLLLRLLPYWDGIEEGERGVLKDLWKRLSSVANSYVDISSTAFSCLYQANPYRRDYEQYQYSGLTLLSDVLIHILTYTWRRPRHVGIPIEAW